MNKRILLFIAVLFTFAGANAQKRFEYVDSSLMNEQQEKHETTEVDESDYDLTQKTEEDIQGDTGVTLRDALIPIDSINAWKNKKEFAYAKNLDSLLRGRDQKTNKNTQQPKFVERKPNAANMDKLFAAGWVRAILWTLAGLFVLYVLYRLFLSDVSFGRSGKKQQAKEVQPVEEEFQLLSNFDQLIHQSCKLGDYRVATRYLFLKTLQRLRDRSMIEYSIDKTNYKYLYELPENKRQDFASLILTYEFLWYGHNEADKETYTGIENNFNNFLNKI